MEASHAMAGVLILGDRGSGCPLPFKGTRRKNRKIPVLASQIQGKHRTWSSLSGSPDKSGNLLLVRSLRSRGLRGESRKNREIHGGSPPHGRGGVIPRLRRQEVCECRARGKDRVSLSLRPLSHATDGMTESFIRGRRGHPSRERS